MEIIFGNDRFWGGEDPDRPLAEITFRRLGNKHLLVDHTFTDPSLRGQGIARQLVEQVVGYARKEGFRIKASCSYARKVLAEADYADVYDGDWTDAG